MELPAEFDKLVEILSAATKNAIGKEFFIKTVANNQGFANLPRSVKINSKTGESFFSNNWISTDETSLTFTASELKSKATLESMKPSSMKDDDDDIEEESTTIGGLDLADL